MFANVTTMNLIAKMEQTKESSPESKTQPRTINCNY